MVWVVVIGKRSAIQLSLSVKNETPLLQWFTHKIPQTECSQTECQVNSFGLDDSTESDVKNFAA